MTFKGRGVAISFTTPVLAGSMIREGRRAGVELVLPNPSGGQGMYVLDWAGVRAICNPTVHDAVLFQRCCRLTSIDPAAIRDIALQVACEGHAGRDAAKAAEAAIAQDRSQRLLTHLLLLSGLVTGAVTGAIDQNGAVDPQDPNGQKFVSPVLRSAELEQRAAAVLQRMAPSFGHPAAHLADWLLTLANLFAPVGFAAGGGAPGGGPGGIGPGGIGPGGIGPGGTGPGGIGPGGTGPGGTGSTRGGAGGGFAGVSPAATGAGGRPPTAGGVTGAAGSPNAAVAGWSVVGAGGGGGVVITEREARISRLLARLEDTSSGLAQWLGDEPGNDLGGLGEAIVMAMRRAHKAGTAVRDWARLALTDAPMLLRRWVKDPDAVADRASRCGWMLDGWERVCLVWLSAGTRASRRAALMEMAPLIPVLPREVLAWAETPVAPEATQQACRVGSRVNASRTGGPAFSLIGRNEKLVALGASPGGPAKPLPEGNQGFGHPGSGYRSFGQQAPRNHAGGGQTR